MSRSTIELKEKKAISSSEYRNIDALSYSALSSYSKSPSDYYRKYILKEEQETTESLKLGQLVDIRVTDSENFDKYFIISTANTPTPQMVRFCQLLLEVFDEKEGIEKGLKLAYAKLDEEKTGSKLQKTFEKMVESFNNEGKDYFKELLDSKTRTLVTIEEATISEEIYKKWENSKQFHCGDCEVWYKFPIVGKIMNLDFKAELDKIVLNHKEKIFYLRDLKISSFVEDFWLKAYLLRNYYLQQGIYRFLFQQWMEQNGYKDWKIDSFSFEVVDATNRLEPLLYVCPDSYYEQSWEGFKVGNTYYKGIVQLIEELLESKRIDKWNISIKNYKNNGVVMMPIIEKNDL